MVKSLTAKTMVVLAAKHPNIIHYQGTVKMRVNVQRLSPRRVTDFENKGGNPEYL